MACGGPVTNDVLGPDLPVCEKLPAAALEIQSFRKASQSHGDMMPHILKAFAATAAVDGLRAAAGPPAAVQAAAPK